MRRKGSGKELEIIRERAISALEKGAKQVEVARIMGVDPATVSRWWTRYKRDPALIRERRHPGPTPKLTPHDMEILTQALLAGPEKFGWKTKVWTCPRVAQVIQRLFGISFHVDHVFKILTRRLGWSSQKPEKMARERRDEEVASWREREFPAIKKKPAGKGQPSSSLMSPVFSSSRRGSERLRQGGRPRS